MSQEQKLLNITSALLKEIRSLKRQQGSNPFLIELFMMAEQSEQIIQEMKIDD